MWEIHGFLKMKHLFCKTQYEITYLNESKENQKAEYL